MAEVALLQCCFSLSPLTFPSRESVPSIAADQRKRREMFERCEFSRRFDPREAQGTDAASSHRQASGGSGLTRTCGARPSGRLRRSSLRSVGHFCQDKRSSTAEWLVKGTRTRSVWKPWLGFLSFEVTESGSLTHPVTAASLRLRSVTERRHKKTVAPCGATVGSQCSAAAYLPLVNLLWLLIRLR
ncbi:hypothetical protein ACSBPQ_15250 [Stenotrophomonas sp. JC08]|uniref:hypothetical protein n=1 Tax=Stenotrophomonas sp. JC08 TaxID=3445779 RepID=UPI003FA2D8E5